MPRHRILDDLTPERVRALLDYDPRTGLLAWRRNRSRMAKAGGEAGTLNKSGVVMVGLDGRMYTAARLIWMHVHGEWPGSRLRFKDGDTQNLRLNNLVPEDKAVRNPTRAAQYQRRWRADQREVDRRIAADPALMRKYAALTDREVILDMRQRLLLEVRDDRMRMRGRHAQE